MTVNEINKRKYWVCCPLCDKQKCVKGTDKCDAEIWAKQEKITVPDGGWINTIPYIQQPIGITPYQETLTTVSTCNAENESV